MFMYVTEPIHVSGHDPLTFLSCLWSFFDWVGVLSKVLKLVRWEILEERGGAGPSS